MAFPESFGVAGHRPTTPDDLREAFTTAVGSDAMHLIEVPVA